MSQRLHASSALDFGCFSKLKSYDDDDDDDDEDYDRHHDYDKESLGLRLGDECRERKPGQLVCGCSNIGWSTTRLS